MTAAGPIRLLCVSALAKRIGLVTLGWIVLVAGLLALVLPGPGLLLTFAGLAILATQYRWARRLMHPVRVKAWRGTAEGVKTIPRIALSALAALTLLGLGLLWLLDPPAPSWWPLSGEWWLVGGLSVGITLTGSSLVAVALLVFAVHRFYGRPESVKAVERMEEVHRARAAAQREARQRLRRLRGPST